MYYSKKTKPVKYLQLKIINFWLKILISIGEKKTGNIFFVQGL